MQDSYIDFKDRLIAYRKSVNFSQEKMAKKIGISQSQYCRIEKENNSVTKDTFIKMYNKGLDIDFFITGIERQKTELDKIWKSCPGDKRAEFLGIIVSYINMYVDDNKAMCKNEIEILKFTVNKANNPTEDSIWKCIRNANNITQEKMANLLGLTKNHYRDIEIGESDPKVEVLVELYEKLGYYPTLVLEVEANYLLCINKIWMTLEEEKKEKLIQILKQNLRFIRRNFKH